MMVVLNETLAKKGVSQYWLSKKTGITTSTLNNLCNNKTSCVQFSVLDKICVALDCDVCDILKNYLFSFWYCNFALLSLYY